MRARLSGSLTLFRLWDRRDEFGIASAHLLRRLPNLIKLPMPQGVFVGRVKDRMIKKFIRHVCCRLSRFSLVESMRFSPLRGAPVTIRWWHRAPLNHRQIPEARPGSSLSGEPWEG
jgi:hypothetical protein